MKNRWFIMALKLLPLKLPVRRENSLSHTDINRHTFIIRIHTNTNIRHIYTEILKKKYMTVHMVEEIGGDLSVSQGK